MVTEPGDRRLTSDEAQVVAALLDSRLPPHSGDLHFLRWLWAAEKHQLPVMNADRRAYLWRITARYHDRLFPRVLEIADRLRPPCDQKLRFPVLSRSAG